MLYIKWAALALKQRTSDGNNRSNLNFTSLCKKWPLTAGIRYI